jgi:rfaE bifunctional protein kinase chain/domain
VGEDEFAKYALDSLEAQGVRCNFFADSTRPTTRKQRFRALNKTLLRVNHLRHHAASPDVQRRMLAAVEAALPKCDLILFSCFNYGCLPQELVDTITAKARAAGVMLAADSQASSQIGDVSRYKNMSLLSPTEREARLALNDFESGLAAVGENLINKARAENVLITLGAEGMLINAWRDGTMRTDRLPAFNPSPKDVSGAGDSVFMSCSMALRVGADIWQSAYLGGLAAALQVSRLGNIPLTVSDIVAEIDETGISHD